MMMIQFNFDWLNVKDRMMFFVDYGSLIIDILLLCEIFLGKSSMIHNCIFFIIIV